MVQSLSSLQRSVMIGTLLGDGNLQTSNGQTWRYRVIQKTAQSEYVNKKYEIFEEFCGTPPRNTILYDPRTGKDTYRRTFNTRTTDAFRFYGQLFYVRTDEGKWKKRVPKDIAKYLDPIALAYWYMDDGALKWKGKSNAVRLCTDSFEYSEVKVLQRALEEKFNLKVTINKARDNHRLCISEPSYANFEKIIGENLIPSMYYKFPDGNYGVYRDQDISNDIFNRLNEPYDSSESLSFEEND